jgi:hypothetical protein
VFLPINARLNLSAIDSDAPRCIDSDFDLTGTNLEHDKFRSDSIGQSQDDFLA